jgi:hypothetical protein
MLAAIGRHADARQLLEPHTENTLHANALALNGWICALMGDMSSAWDDAGLALEAAPDSFAALISNALVRAYHAGHADDVMVATGAVGECLGLLERSESIAIDDDITTVDALLARGRLYLLMPSAFKVREHGIRDLTQVIERCLRLDSGLPNSESGLLAVCRLQAAFHLAEALSHQPERASQLFHEVLVIDPASALAERAYKRISSLHAING